MIDAIKRTAQAISTGATRFVVGGETVWQMTFCTGLCCVVYTSNKCSLQLSCCKERWHYTFMKYMRSPVPLPVWELPMIQYFDLLPAHCPWCWHFGKSQRIKKHDCCRQQLVCVARVFPCRDIAGKILKIWAFMCRSQYEDSHTYQARGTGAYGEAQLGRPQYTYPKRTQSR
jgi:hypothetical protein